MRPQRIVVRMVAAAVSIACAGCHGTSSGTGTSTQSVRVVGASGKVYSGTQSQVTSSMGQDYAQGLRNMAAQRGAH